MSIVALSNQKRRALLRQALRQLEETVLQRRSTIKRATVEFSESPDRYYGYSGHRSVTLRVDFYIPPRKRIRAAASASACPVDPDGLHHTGCGCDR